MKIHMELQYVHLMEESTHIHTQKNCCYRAKVWKEVKEKLYVYSMYCMVNKKRHKNIIEQYAIGMYF